MAMSILPSQAPSMRTCATRLPPASTTARFIGWLISVAWASPAARTRFASASENVCCSFTGGVSLGSVRAFADAGRPWFVVALVEVVVAGWGSGQLRYRAQPLPPDNAALGGPALGRRRGRHRPCPAWRG